MSKAYLSKTRTRNFSTLNSYKRALGKDGQTTNKDSWEAWEQKYTGETIGYSYEEDQQTYKRLLAYDEKHGTKTAEFFQNFHELWYWDQIDPDWSAQLKADRRKDIYQGSQRVDLMDIQDTETSKEVTHNPEFGLDRVPTDSEPVTKHKPKTRYSPGDYQYTINPFSSRWADILINQIDRQRGVSERDELDVGVVFLKRGQSRWGFTAPYHGLWIVTMVFAGEEPERVATTNGELAKQIIKELRAKYKARAVSREDLEFFILERRD